jgi:hypothetical protein
LLRAHDKKKIRNESLEVNPGACIIKLSEKVIIRVFVALSYFHSRKSLNKIKTLSSRENKVNTYGPPGFAPDYSATGLTTKCELTPNEHSMCIRFFCLRLLITLANTLSFNNDCK